jgi:hypothetical protein
LGAATTFLGGICLAVGFDFGFDLSTRLAASRFVRAVRCERF